MILPKVRDPRFITIRRGGTLTDANHRLLAIWAAQCALHVIDLFEKEHPDDHRPRTAIELAIKWSQGTVTLNEAKKGAFDANAAASPLSGAARFAAYSAGQAAVVGHVAAHELGAAAYAIKAVMAASDGSPSFINGRNECAWQRSILPVEIKELVLDDQMKRNAICWNVFTINEDYHFL